MKDSALRRALREPLLHFLLLGGALFALYQATGSMARAPAGTITVSEGRIRNLADTFARTWQRPPTAPELDGLIEDFIREEVRYREAVALGLDRDDTVVRRRLRQKLEFISEDEAAGVEPTEAQLAEYLAAHAQDYSVAARLSFRQVFLDPQRHGAALEADALALLDALRSRARTPDLDRLGDRLMLEPAYSDVAATEVARLFGEAFAGELLKAPVGEWSGPLRSGYGAHLVRIDAREPGRAPPLAEVREQVRRDWAAAQRRAALDAQYQALRQRYAIRIERARVEDAPR